MQVQVQVQGTDATGSNGHPRIKEETALAHVGTKRSQSPAEPMRGPGIAMAALGLGAFSFGIAEFLGMGFLPQLAHGLAISEPRLVRSSATTRSGS